MGDVNNRVHRAITRVVRHCEGIMKLRQSLRAACAELGTFAGAIALLAASAGALAATVDPKISMPAQSVPETVTVSNSTSQQTPVTYVAYLVSLNNGGGSDINQLRIDATSSVTAGLTAAVIQSQTVNPAMPSQCTVVDATHLSCNFGTIPPGAVVSFPVIVAVPQYAGAPVANQSITLSLHSSFREGKSGSASNNSLGELDTTVNTPVAAQSATSLKSVVIKAGGNFFTGGNGVPKTGDVYTSNVAFAALAANFSLVTIDETPFETASFGSCVGGKHFRTCFATKLFAPDVDYSSSGGFLTEVIRVHPDNFKSGFKAETVLYEYTPTDSNGNASGAAQIVGLCANATSPRTDGIPCQTAPVKCYKKSTPGWTADLDGVCEWTFINTRNGFMRGY
jgi:hypothetical protein